MAVNAETLVVSYLNGIDGFVPEAFQDVPDDRPPAFITVERTGGPRDTFRDLPVLAVQCWDQTRYLASALAAEVADHLEQMRFHPQVARVEINSLYNFPDLDGRQARYQIVVVLVTKD